MYVERSVEMSVAERAEQGSQGDDDKAKQQGFEARDESERVEEPLGQASMGYGCYGSCDLGHEFPLRYFHFAAGRVLYVL